MMFDNPRGFAAPAQPQVVYGEVSRLQPAPVSFTAPLYVVLPDLDVDTAYEIVNWPQIHGATLPAVGAACQILIDDRGNKRVAWWDGAHT